MYHAEDSPPPEGDAKLLERLVDHFGEFANADEMTSKIESHHDNYVAYQPVLKEFYSAFGQYDKTEKKGCETLCCSKVAEGNTRDAVQTQVNNLLSNIFAYKQIEEDRAFADFKVKEEERKRLEAEAAENATGGDDVSNNKSAAPSGRNDPKSQSNTGDPKPSIDSGLPVDKSIKQ